MNSSHSSLQFLRPCAIVVSCTSKFWMFTICGVKYCLFSVGTDLPDSLWAKQCGNGVGYTLILHCSANTQRQWQRVVIAESSIPFQMRHHKAEMNSGGS